MRDRILLRKDFVMIVSRIESVDRIECRQTLSQSLLFHDRCRLIAK